MIIVKEKIKNISVESKGTPGTDGNNGKSAFEIWKDQGNVGSEEEFLSSLKGTDGNNGVGVPSGGTSGQILSKKTNNNFDTEWIDPTSNGGSSYLAGIGVFIDEDNSISANVKSKTGKAVFVGLEAGGGISATSTSNAISVGYRALRTNSGNDLISIGDSAANYTSGINNNISIGTNAGSFVNYSDNIYVGRGTQSGGGWSTIVGHNSKSSAHSCSIFGYNSIINNSNYNNCSLFGYNVTATGSNQVQLGDTNSSVYVSGTVQTRSDERDKLEIQDCDKGLDFILMLKPRKYKFNHRERYFEFYEDEEEVSYIDENNEEKKAVNKIMKKRFLNNDGSKSGIRFHYGLIAQEVEKIIQETGQDFGGYQDHLVNGGEDVKSLGYEEFIAPLIKSVQELNEKIKTLEENIKLIKGE